MVPMARMSPQESNVCFAISIEADASNLPTLRAELARRVVEQLVDRDVPRDDFLLERVLDDQFERLAHRRNPEGQRVDAAGGRGLLAGLEQAEDFLHDVGPRLRQVLVDDEDV